jgi:hypothetical protein
MKRTHEFIRLSWAVSMLSVNKWLKGVAMSFSDTCWAFELGQPVSRCPKRWDSWMKLLLWTSITKLPPYSELVWLISTEYAMDCINLWLQRPDPLWSRSTTMRQRKLMIFLCILAQFPKMKVCSLDHILSSSVNYWRCILCVIVLLRLWCFKCILFC